MPERAKAMKGIGWTVAALTFIFCCVIIALRQQIA
jgi:hypothetical protein